MADTLSTPPQANADTNEDGTGASPASIVGTVTPGGMLRADTPSTPPPGSSSTIPFGDDLVSELLLVPTLSSGALALSAEDEMSAAALAASNRRAAAAAAAAAAAWPASARAGAAPAAARRTSPLVTPKGQAPTQLLLRNASLAEVAEHTPQKSTLYEFRRALGSSVVVSGVRAGVAAEHSALHAVHNFGYSAGGYGDEEDTRVSLEHERVQLQELRAQARRDLTDDVLDTDAAAASAEEVADDDDQDADEDDNQDDGDEDDEETDEEDGDDEEVEEEDAEDCEKYGEDDEEEEGLDKTTARLTTKAVELARRHPASGTPIRTAAGAAGVRAEAAAQFEAAMASARKALAQIEEASPPAVHQYREQQHEEKTKQRRHHHAAAEPLTTVHEYPPSPRLQPWAQPTATSRQSATAAGAHASSTVHAPTHASAPAHASASAADAPPAVASNHQFNTHQNTHVLPSQRPRLAMLPLPRVVALWQAFNSVSKRFSWRKAKIEGELRNAPHERRAPHIDDEDADVKTYLSNADTALAGVYQILNHPSMRLAKDVQDAGVAAMKLNDKRRFWNRTVPRISGAPIDPLMVAVFRTFRVKHTAVVAAIAACGDRYLAPMPPGVEEAAYKALATVESWRAGELPGVAEPEVAPAVWTAISTAASAAVGNAVEQAMRQFVSMQGKGGAGPAAAATPAPANAGKA